VKDDENKRVLALYLYNSNDLNLILGHQKADKAKIHNNIVLNEM
jgi:hypothetical protein